MDLFSHYSRLLSIGDGWKVADVKLEMGQLRVDIYLDNNEKCAPYSECVQRLNGATNDWNVSVWENTGERDMRRSAYFDPTPRQLVKSRHVACGPDMRYDDAVDPGLEIGTDAVSPSAICP